MKKALQATLVFLLVATLAFCSISVSAEQEKIEFTPDTATSYGYSCDEWYDSDVNSALLCYSLLKDTNEVTDFFTNGDTTNVYITHYDDTLTLFINMGDYSIFYNYIPDWNQADRSILGMNVNDQFEETILPQMVEQLDAEYKAISDEGWSDMYELLGITKEELQGTNNTGRKETESIEATSENTPEPAATPKLTSGPTYLQKGSKSENVKAVQERLIELGYLGGTADGEFGKKTEAAVEAFQEAYSLDVTGIVTDVEMHAMYELPDIIASVPTGTPEVVTGNLTIKNCKDLAKILKSKDPNATIIKEFAERYSGMTIEFDGNIAYINNHGDYNTRYDILVHAGNYSETSTSGPDFQFEDVGVVDLDLSGLYMTDLISIGDKVHIIAEVGEYHESSGLFELKPVSVIVK